MTPAITVQRSWVQISYTDLNFFQVLFLTTHFSSVLSCKDLLIMLQLYKTGEQLNIKFCTIKAIRDIHKIFLFQMEQ